MKKEYFLIIVLCTAAYIAAAEQDDSALSASQAESACKSYELFPADSSSVKTTSLQTAQAAIWQAFQAAEKSSTAKITSEKSSEQELNREHFFVSDKPLSSDQDTIIFIKDPKLEELEWVQSSGASVDDEPESPVKR